MIPHNKIVSEYVESEWLYDNTEEDLIYLSPGGKDIKNIEESPTYQMWEMYFENNIIKLKSKTNNKNYDIRAISDITELSFSFSLNMNLTYLYVKEEITYLNYYDATIQETVEIALFDMKHPKLIYDDYRKTQTMVSDILLIYINHKRNKLCYRMLRDRYTIEYDLADVLNNTRLVRVGMSNKYRLKFKLQGF